MVIMDEQSFDSRSGNYGSTKSQPQDQFPVRESQDEFGDSSARSPRSGNQHVPGLHGASRSPTIGKLHNNRDRILFLTSLLSGIAMLAKRTSKNQVTLPKAIVQKAGEADYYDVTVQDGKIVLTPVRLHQADAVRAKLEELGITQDDVGEAIAWARARA
jgi:hypothetical protein